jgi:hypothetical protein
MKAPSVNVDASAVLVGGAVVIGAVLLFVYRDKLAVAFDVNNPNNIASSAGNAVARAITGGTENGGEDSLGGVAARVREWLSGDDARIKELTEGAPAGGDASQQMQELFYGLGA